MVHLPKLFLANVSLGNMFTSPNTTQQCKQNDTKKLRLTLQIQQIERQDEVEVPECQQRGFSKLLPTKPLLVKEPMSSWPSELMSSVPGTEQMLTCVSADKQ